MKAFLCLFFSIHLLWFFCLILTCENGRMFHIKRRSSFHAAKHISVSLLDKIKESRQSGRLCRFFCLKFFLEVRWSASETCGWRRQNLKWVVPQPSVPPGVRRVWASAGRSSVVLRHRVWSGGNGQKGKRAFACGVAQNELLPSFCSSASQ